MKHVEGLPNSAGTRNTAVAFFRVQSPRSGVTAAEQIRTRAVSTETSLALEKLAVSFVANSSVGLGRGVKTATWWGEAGIPAIVSEGLGDRPLMLADPTTDHWCGLMGKPVS